MFAAQQGYETIVVALLAGGAAVNYVKENGSTPLTVPVVKGHVGVVKALLRAGAEVDKTGTTATPLLVAAHGGSVGVVSALLRAGAEAHKADDYGNTPMMVATHGGQRAIMAALTQMGGTRRL
uniref:Ankyrin repeat domain-containing protein n=1 Tax=Mantoniella antarctica TaxID=81844 RepID=A0A7S0SQW8_9CHLO|mmetsp:Transcript_33022/g.83286  ORF Transcript_33022/g.83286 Transcript_33022/m.83286 type:complete len:123 (+) Transcript_33022:97-465(+)